MGWGDDASRCFTTKNKGLWGWARPIWLFPLVKPYRKSTPGGRWSIPLQSSPRIIKQYAPITTANRQARQARRRRSPCRRSAMRCPLCCFWRSALTEHGAETIAYNQSKNESKRNKQTRQKAKEKGKPIILYSTHIQKQEKRKASNNRQARQREKQERSPKSI